jgi:hypothetical protein
MTDELEPFATAGVTGALVIGLGTCSLMDLKTRPLATSDRVEVRSRRSRSAWYSPMIASGHTWYFNPSLARPAK